MCLKFVDGSAVVVSEAIFVGAASEGIVGAPQLYTHGKRRDHPIGSVLTGNRFVRPRTLPSFASGSMPLPWRGRQKDVCRIVQSGLSGYVSLDGLGQLERVLELHPDENGQQHGQVGEPSRCLPDPAHRLSTLPTSILYGGAAASWYSPSQQSKRAQDFFTLIPASVRVASVPAK
jgi:hypothetical protein